MHDLLSELIFLAGPRRTPQIKQLSFACQRISGLGIVEATSKFLRHRDRIGPVALGREPGLARIKPSEPLGDDRQVGAGNGFIEANENVASLHPIAVMHAHLADHAARRMLHFLYVGIDNERALGDQRAGDFGGRCPAAETARQKYNDHNTSEDVPADRCARTPGQLFAHPAQHRSLEPT